MQTFISEYDTCWFYYSDDDFYSDAKPLITESMKKSFNRKKNSHKFKIKSNNNKKHYFFPQVVKPIKDISSAVMAERRHEGTC